MYPEAASPCVFSPCTGDFQLLNLPAAGLGVRNISFTPSYGWSHRTQSPAYKWELVYLLMGKAVCTGYNLPWYISTSLRGRGLLAPRMKWAEIKNHKLRLAMSKTQYSKWSGKLVRFRSRGDVIARTLPVALTSPSLSYA